MNVTEKLEQFVESYLSPEGYELVALEAVTNHNKTLRLYIDRTQKEGFGGISLSDCIKVTKLLDEPLDQNPEIDQIFKGPFELEVSSPGIERPLRREKDFMRFVGEQARIHLFRPMTAAECENETYATQNPKRKNYLGTIKGFENKKVILELNPLDGTDKKGSPKKKANASKSEKPKTVVKIPVEVMSKANLEPNELRFEPGKDETVFEI